MPRVIAIVAAARAVAVEIGGLDTVRDEVSAGGRILLDAAGRRDVVGRHRIAKDAERGGVADIADRAGRHREVLEERRFLDVGAPGVPAVHVADGGGDFVPGRVLRGEILVQRAEDFRFERAFHRVADFLHGRP